MQTLKLQGKLFSVKEDKLFLCEVRYNYLHFQFETE